MNRHRLYRVVALILSLCIAVSMSPTALAYTPKYQHLAQLLYGQGLLAGDGSGDFVLDRTFTRAEMAVMTVRLMGKTDEVKNSSYAHPFGDVRSLTPWADSYVGYLYQNGLIAGKSACVYGAKDVTTFRQYVAVVLRVLGYSEAAGDFNYQNPDTKAWQTGLLTQEEIDGIRADGVFLRDHMVLITFESLKTRMKNGGILLRQLGLNPDAITETYTPYVPPAPDAPAPPQFTEGNAIPMSEDEISSSVGPAVFMLKLYDEKDKLICYGCGVNLTETGVAVTCCYLMKKAFRAEAVFDGNRTCAVSAVYGTDSDQYIAVIKLDSSTALPAASIALSSNVSAEDQVYAIGYYKEAKKRTAAVVERIIPDQMYITSSQRGLGFDGGALVDACGRVIGIYAHPINIPSKIDLKLNQENFGVNYAIFIDQYLDIPQNEGTSLSEFMKQQN